MLANKRQLIYQTTYLAYRPGFYPFVQVERAISGNQGLWIVAILLTSRITRYYR